MLNVRRYQNLKSVQNVEPSRAVSMIIDMFVPEINPSETSSSHLSSRSVDLNAQAKSVEKFLQNQLVELIKDLEQLKE